MLLCTAILSQALEKHCSSTAQRAASTVCTCRTSWRASSPIWKQEPSPSQIRTVALPCGAPDIPRFCCLCRKYALSVFTLDASGDKIGRGVHIDQLRAVMSKMALISKGTLTSLLHGQTCRVTHSTSDVAQLSTRNGHFWQETHLICDAILSLVANQWQLIRLIMVIGAMQAFAVGL